LAYLGLVVLRSVAEEYGRGRVAAMAAELGAYLWPRLDDATAADAMPAGMFRPFRRSLAAWPDGVARARAVLAERVQAMATPLSEAKVVILAAPDMPRRVARDAASAVARLHDVAEWWAAWQFEPRELATLGAVAWADEIIPRMDAGTIAAAALRVGVALAVDEIARTDEEDAAGLHHLHAALAELAEAVPPILWPSFEAAGKHHTAPVAEVGHG
jgi:hypothetical protein